MNFESYITDIMTGLLSDGTAEKIIREKMEEGLRSAIKDAFSWGDVNEALRNKVTEVLLPFIENYDMQDYTLKLDTVLSEILAGSVLEENRKVLENFRYLMKDDAPDRIKLSDLFEEYEKFVASHVNTCGREVDEDSYSEDGPNYVPIETYLEVSTDEKRSWSSFTHGTVVFGVYEEDQSDLCRQYVISRWRNDPDGEWKITVPIDPDVTSLRRLNSFDVLLLKLSKAGVKLEVDTTLEQDEVVPEDKPEAIFS